MILIEQLNNTFRSCCEKNCLEETDLEIFEIKDDDKPQNSPCKLVSKGQFKVENPCKHVLYFLKIDHCILSNKDSAKCDFAIFNADELIFVELKEIKNNTSQKKTEKNIKDKIQRASKQLKETLKTFKKKNIDLSHYKKLFVIISILDHNKISVLEPDIQTQAVFFEKKYKATLLFEDTHTFEK